MNAGLLRPKATTRNGPDIDAVYMDATVALNRPGRLAQ